MMRWFPLLVFWGCVSFEDLESTDSPPISTDSAAGEGHGGVSDSAEIFDDSGSDDSGSDDSGSDDSGTDDSDTEPAGDYSRWGPWALGNSITTITGSSLDALYVYAWYPTADSGGASRTYGWTGFEFTGGAQADAAPACEETRPVMVHSHGNSSLAWEMYGVMEFMASHGWIVVAPDHAGNTLYANTEDFFTLVWRRPQDIRDSFDWLVEQSEDPSSDLYGCIDPDAGYVASGYSFGGYTAMVGAGALVNDATGPTYDFGDPRIWAVSTYAAWNAYEALTTGTAAIGVPAITFGGLRDTTVFTQWRDLHDEISSTPRAMATFPDAGHFSFAPIYCWSRGDGCGSDYVDPEAVLSDTATSILAFLEHLRGRSGALEQLAPESDELRWEVVD